MSTVPCVLTLHYLTVRAPDSCSLKDEHASNSWSELRIRVVFLLMLQLFFFLTNHCSYPEVRMLLLRNLIPFRFCSTPSKILEVHTFPFRNHGPISFSQSLDLPTPTLHRSHSQNPNLSSKSFNCCCWLMVAGQRSEREEKEEKDGTDEDKK